MKFILWKEILLLGIFVLFWHIVSLKFHLYWIVWWFDIPMHFLGGLLIGLIFISLMNRFINKNSKDLLVTSKSLLIIFTIFFVMIFGLTWELWELFIGFTTVIKDKGDTILDIIMDFIGGLFSVFYYYFKYTK